MSEVTTDVRVWRSALDAFESGLTHHQHLLETGEDLGSSPWPPANLPMSPVPAELRPHAAKLLSRAEELTDGILRKLADLPAPESRRRVPRAPVEHARWTATL